MNDKVNELVERRAMALFEDEQKTIIAEQVKLPNELTLGKLHTKDWGKLQEEDRNYWRGKIMVALDDPDLALIDRDSKIKKRLSHGVILLAEALKEKK